MKRNRTAAPRHLSGVHGYRVPNLGYMAADTKQAMRDKLIDHQTYISQYGDDRPEVRDWKWGSA